MQTSHHPKPKATKLLEIKLFIATMTVAITIGLWNLLSNNAVQADKLSSSAGATLPTQAPAGLALDFPPLPTLVPVMSIEVSTTGALAPGTSAQTTNNPTQLRSVAIPTQTIVQQNAPVVQAPVVVVSGNNAGSTVGGSSKPAPVTTTRSSRP